MGKNTLLGVIAGGAIQGMRIEGVNDLTDERGCIWIVSDLEPELEWVGKYDWRKYGRPCRYKVSLFRIGPHEKRNYTVESILPGTY
jgi:hypothetical protein